MGTEEVEPVSFPVEPNRLISVGSGLVSGSMPAGNITRPGPQLYRRILHYNGDILILFPEYYRPNYRSLSEYFFWPKGIRMY